MELSRKLQTRDMPLARDATGDVQTLRKVSLCAGPRDTLVGSFGMDSCNMRTTVTPLPYDLSLPVPASSTHSLLRDDDKAQPSLANQELEQAVCVAEEMSARSCGHSANPDRSAALCATHRASVMLDPGLHTTT